MQDFRRIVGLRHRARYYIVVCRTSIRLDIRREVQRPHPHDPLAVSRCARHDIAGVGRQCADGCRQALDARRIRDHGAGDTRAYRYHTNHTLRRNRHAAGADMFRVGDGFPRLGLCAHCKDPAPKLDDEMNSSLPNGDLGYIQWKEWNCAEFGRFTAQDAAVYAREMQNAGVYLGRDTSVMEIGFGNGAFAGWVRSKMSRYVGTESNRELIARAEIAGIEVHLATFDLERPAAGRVFDLVAIFDVLEHLDTNEILQLLKSASKCLSSTGRLVFRVPSGDSPFSGHLMYGDITHKTKLGSKAIHQIATLTGMEVVSIRDAAFPIRGTGVMMIIRRLAVVSVRKMVGGIIKAAFFGNEQAVISPNLVAVLKPRSVASQAAVDGKS